MTLQRARTLALVAMGVFLAVPAHAQNGTVSGRVTDAATGLPLPGATVSVQGGPSTQADAFGHYTL
ncbi:MAG TPA: hypothetical protein VNP72_07565, partial [Longimicrobium sp.]|nr:hypothetical protein [Longimicrobium sp.]